MINLRNLLIISISFSDLTFGLFPGETNGFPLLISLYLNFIEKNISSVKLIIIITITLLLYYISLLQGVEHKAIFISIFIYLQNYFVFIYFSKTKKSFNIKLIKYIIFVHIIFGIMQIFKIVPESIKQLLDICMGRFFDEALEERGIAFLTTEPSHALLSIIFPIFLLSFSKKFLSCQISKVTFILTIFLSGVGTSFIFMIIFLTRYIFSIKNLLISMFAIILMYTYSSKVYGLINDFIIITSVLNYQSFLDVLLLTGHRVTSVYSSFYSILLIPDYIGPGAWSMKMLNSIESAGFIIGEIGHWKGSFVYEEFKPSSFIANLFIDFWLIGLIISLYIINKILINFSTRKNNFTVFQRAIISVAIFSFIFLGTAGKVSMIAIIALSLFNRHINLYNE